MSRSIYARLAHRFDRRTDELDRREFLKLTLAASAGLLMSCASGPDHRGRSGSAGPRIVVIGGGLGGLACAHELISVGYDVTLLEARNRIGGRVVSFRDLVPGKNIEGGGELIGSNHPTWMAYAKNFHLKLADVTQNEDLEAPIQLGGRRLSPAEARSLHDEMKLAFATMTVDARAINSDEPWKSPNAAALDQKSAADWLAGLGVSALCRTAITAELEANNGVALSRQSYLGNLTQVKGGGLEKFWTETEVFRCQTGNHDLARRLALAIGPYRTRFQTIVTAIAVLNEQVMVSLADGTSLETDGVVLAVPPSVWSRIRFNPELPATLRPQMGVAVKYLAAVKRRFWRDARLSPDSFTDGPLSMTWDGTDGQAGETGACLTVYSGGPAAETCRQRWLAEKELAFHGELERLYPKFAENLTGSRFMDWPGDPWTAAGFSFPAPGQVTTVGPLLRRGLDGLHFAGEHACYKFAGYMEGALNSGVTLARRLAVRDRMV